jgi:hypothetical protein
MLDQFHGGPFPKLGVLEVKVVAVETQEMPHRAESCALITLLEGVRVGDAR